MRVIAQRSSQRVEMRVLLLDALEPTAFERRLLRVGDLRFDLPFEVGCIRPAWQRDNAVVLEHLGVEPVELRIVHVGLEHALFEIVEPDGMCRAAEIRERRFVQPAPDLARRVPNDLAKCKTAVA